MWRPPAPDPQRPPRETGPVRDRTPDAGNQDGDGGGLQRQAGEVLSQRGGNTAYRAQHRRAEVTSGQRTTDVTIVGDGDGDGGGNEKPRRKLATDKSPSDLAKPSEDGKERPAFVDKTKDHADKFKDAGDGKGDNPNAPPKISVELENKEKPAEKEPHFVVKKDGTVEMHGDPEQLKAKQVRVVLEREQGDVNPTEEQKKAADELVAYLNERMKKNFPQEADKITLEDKDDVISAETEGKLKPPPEQEQMTPETRQSVGETNRFNGSGGADMPRAASEGMGSFNDGARAAGERQKGETDQTAALKEAIAGLWKPDKDHPYETIRKHPDGDTRVGRYGFSGRQINSFADWLAGLSPEQIEKLIAEGKLPKDLADPKKMEEYLKSLKEMGQKLESGGSTSAEELKQLLPKETQETMAGMLTEAMAKNPAVGNDPGKISAAMLSGKAPDQVTAQDMSSPGAQQLADAGKKLYDIATARQQTDAGTGPYKGDRVPEGDRRDLITKALQIAGEPVNESTIAAVNTIVQHESGWNPNARNNWDINAKNGVPSQGLAQTIPPTFNAHKDKSGQVEAAGHSNTILDPLANLVAAINYSQSRYGGVERVPGVVSTRRGGGYKPY